jgi:hypothetical protein
MLRRYCCVGFINLIFFFKLHATALIPLKVNGGAFASAAKQDPMLQLMPLDTGHQWSYIQSVDHGSSSIKPDSI